MRIEEIPQKSNLIDQAAEEQMKPVLEQLDRFILLVCSLDDTDTAKELGGLMNHFASLSDKIKVQFQKAENTEALLPMVAFFQEEKPLGIVFHGVPGGKEMNSFLLALYNAAGPGQQITEEMRSRIMQLDKHLKLEVIVSLSCHHCAQVVIACQRIAALNPNIEAHMIDARLYPELVKEYEIERIPMLMINRDRVIMGEKSMEELVRALEKYTP